MGIRLGFGEWYEDVLRERKVRGGAAKSEEMKRGEEEECHGAICSVNKQWRRDVPIEEDEEKGRGS